MLMLVSHLGAISIALSLPQGVGLRGIVTAVVTASLAWQWRQSGKWCAGEWRIDDQGSCSWFPNGNNTIVRYELLQADAGVWWVRLWLEQSPKQRCHLFIWRDAVGPEIYRELNARIEQRRLPPRDRNRF